MKISVAIGTYNGEKFLNVQLESILQQTIPVHEIIVCDDHSGDDTINILREFEVSYPSLFKIFANEKNLGVVKNFEKAISLCTGDIIFLADQDDLWNNNKVESVLNFFRTNINCYGMFSDAELIDDTSTINNKTLWELLQFNEALSIDTNPDIFRYLLLYRNVVTGACLAVKREALDFILPFPKDGKMLHDQWIGLKLGEYNRIGMVKQTLLQYRLHSAQETKSIWQNFTDRSRMVRSSIITDDVNVFPFEYYRYWKKKLITLNTMKVYGICINESIVKEVKYKIRKGLIAHLKSLSFFQRKSTLLKLYLKQQEEVAFTDIVKI